MMDKDIFLIFAAEEDWQVADIDVVYDRFKQDNILDDVYRTHTFNYQFLESMLNLHAQGKVEPVTTSPYNDQEERSRLSRGKNFLDYMETRIRAEQGEKHLELLRMKVSLMWGQLNNSDHMQKFGMSQN